MALYSEQPVTKFVLCPTKLAQFFTTCTRIAAAAVQPGLQLSVFDAQLPGGIRQLGDVFWRQGSRTL